MEAANVHFVQEKRRSDDGARNTVLDGTKGAKSGAGKSSFGILHEGVDGSIVADAEHVAKRAQGKPLEMAAADEFFMAIGNIDAVDKQGDALTGGKASGQGAEEVGIILLIERGESGIIHLLDFETPGLTIVMTSLQELLAKSGGIDAFARGEK